MVVFVSLGAGEGVAALLVLVDAGLLLLMRLPRPVIALMAWAFAAPSLNVSFDFETPFAK